MINLSSILFLDIETVPQYPTWVNVPERWKELWSAKAASLSNNPDDTPESLYQRAGIYAEFGKIICISCGFLSRSEGQERFRMKSFYGNDEKQLLAEFGELLNKITGKSITTLCAHNGKEFDFPWIARRMVIHGIPLPELLDVAGKKPWEVNLLDTMELWKFGDRKSYTTLNLLAATLDVPTPKDDIDGSQVARVYYEEQNLERIVTYCQKDVLTVAQVVRRFRREPLIPEDAVVVS